MSELYNRDFGLKIGPTPIEVHLPSVPIKEDDKPTTTLRVQFNIEKTSVSNPNTGEVTIYNLSETNRKLLQQFAGKPAQMFPLSIEAGYMGTRELIFIGDILNADSFREGVSWLTKISASDGGQSYSSKRFSKTFTKGTALIALVLAVIGAAGLGPGNAAAILVTSPRGLTVFQKSITISGRVSNILDKYIASAGFQWSIQNGQVQLREPFKANGEPVVLLNQYTGLIGVPEIGEKGKISFTSLLQGSIRPGRRVILESSSATGTFVVESARYSGDTWGNDWYVQGDAVPEVLI
jgi:hypothetical protein